MRAFCRKFLEDLPPLNYNVFVYVLSFLREVLAEESYNRYICYFSNLCMHVYNARLSLSTSPSLLAAICVANMTYSPSPPVAAGGAADGGGGDYSLVVLSKDERARRAAKQAYLQSVIAYLLSTTSSL